MAAALHDPRLKAAAREAYRLALAVLEWLSAPVSGGGGEPRVWYGGAVAGNLGGPRVKVKRLAAAFPEHRWTYNLVYLLSNAPYLPAPTLRHLKARGIPLVLNQNGVFYPAWYAGDWEAQNRRMAEAYHLADHVFFQSDFCRRAAERFLGRRTGAGEILPNAVDTGHFRPPDRDPAAAAPFTALAAGKVQAHQAYRLVTTVDGIADARRHGLDARLVVAGAIAAEARAAAEAAATRGAVPVGFHGPYTQEAAPALFGAADAYINTNHNDACPSTVVEALACGVPVVYAASGGIPELVGPDAGIGIETGESWTEARLPAPAALADALVRIAESRARMAAAARARAVERFDIRPWLDRHAAVFRDLIQASERRR